MNELIRLEELKDACKPFAKLLKPHVDIDAVYGPKPDDRPVFGIDDAVITVGDLRRLNKLLKDSE